MLVRLVNQAALTAAAATTATVHESNVVLWRLLVMVTVISLLELLVTVASTAAVSS